MEENKEYGPKFTKLIQEKEPETITMEEALKFAEWCSRFQWVYSFTEVKWWNKKWLEEDNQRPEYKTTVELLEIFRSGKERIKND